jgi:hypothetical protein
MSSISENLRSISLVAGESSNSNIARGEQAFLTVVTLNPEARNTVASSRLIVDAENVISLSPLLKVFWSSSATILVEISRPVRRRGVSD